MVTIQNSWTPLEIHLSWDKVLLVKLRLHNNISENLKYVKIVWFPKLGKKVFSFLWILCRNHNFVRSFWVKINVHNTLHYCFVCFSKPNTYLKGLIIKLFIILLIIMHCKFRIMTATLGICKYWSIFQFITFILVQLINCKHEFKKK